MDPDGDDVDDIGEKVVACTVIQNWELHLEIIWSNQNDLLYQL